MRKYIIDGGFGKEGFDLYTHPLPKYNNLTNSVDKPVDNMLVSCAEPVEWLGLTNSAEKAINN